MKKWGKFVLLILTLGLLSISIYFPILWYVVYPRQGVYLEKPINQLEDGEIEDYTDSPEFQIFKNPNPWQTAYDFWEATFAFLELTGECPWALIKTGSRLDGIVPLRPDKITVVPSATDLVSHYIFSNAGEDYRIETDEMIFIKYFNPESSLSVRPMSIQS